MAINILPKLNNEIDWEGLSRGWPIIRNNLLMGGKFFMLTMEIQIKRLLMNFRLR